MSDSRGCANCAAAQAQVAQLQAQLARLRSEVQRLQRENERLRRQLERLKEAIRRAIETCRFYLQKAGETLRHKSGIPRGQWAYAKGAYTVAARLVQILSQAGG